MENIPLEMLGHETQSFHNIAEVGVRNTIVVPVKDSFPHALFMDCTHGKNLEQDTDVFLLPDNETPHQKRTADDTLPNAAVVAMTHWYFRFETRF